MSNGSVPQDNDLGAWARALADMFRPVQLVQLHKEYSRRAEDLRLDADNRAEARRRADALERYVQ